MSWDLYVLPLAAGEDPAEALDRIEEAAAAPDEHRKDELAALLEQTWAEHARADPPAQVTVRATYVNVSVPYWDAREHSDSLPRDLTSFVSAVVERTGWSVYDPQAGRVVAVDELPRLFVEEQRSDGAPIAPEKHRKRLFGIL